MIAGACQADVGVLVISARKGEFETGFDRGGQTREHAMLAKTLGVRVLVVAINKMDDPTVEFSQERFDECVEKLSPFLKTCGYNIKKDCVFVPLSALTATNVLEKSDKLPWYDGPTFLEVLDTLPAVERNKDSPLRLPILSKYKDMGTTIEGKVEQGTVKPGDKLWVMPNRVPVEVLNVWLDQDEVPQNPSSLPSLSALPSKPLSSPSSRTAIQPQDVGSSIAALLPSRRVDGRTDQTELRLPPLASAKGGLPCPEPGLQRAQTFTLTLHL